MKKRNYVLAISLIAMLAQTGDMSAMGWARGKAGQAKAATVDALYKKAKAFVKEVRTLKRCHKDGDCTPAQYRKIKIMGAGVAVTAAAVVVIGLGVGAVVQEARDLDDQAARKFGISYQSDLALLQLVANNDVVTIKGRLEHEKGYSNKTIDAALWIIRKRPLSKRDTDTLIKELNRLRLRKQ